MLSATGSLNMPTSKVEHFPSQ